MPADLLTSPRYLAEHLGLPMPDSPHAVSACLPTWADNVGYEEGDAAVIAKLQAAYPRFCLHPFVRQVNQTFLGGETIGLVFPSVRVARRAAQYVTDRGGGVCQIRTLPGTEYTGVVPQDGDFGRLKEYWQHAGEVLTSRAAGQLLRGTSPTISESPARQTVRRRVGMLSGLSADHVWLCNSGMAAVHTAWRCVRQLFPTQPSVQFGFPYVDTLKIQERFPPTAYRFFPTGSRQEIDQLRALAEQQSLSAVFCETPANPLLRCPDLVQLRELADQYGFLLIVDDTLGACLNLDVLGCADVVVTSLTKYFSGYGDVLAGSVILNPNGRFHTRLRAAMDSEFEELLCDADVDVLCSNSNDLETRIHRINRNADQIASRLVRHPAVADVFHPSVHRDAAYETLKRGPDAGNGGLMSVVLHDAARVTPAVFDRLRVCKGPNLGTNFTLCCPYTILAHYNELDIVEQYGVSRWLLRISVGTEPLEELWARFEDALTAAQPTELT
ncbi:MAG: PLP-dependent transferase [Planctomycetaceae bacterium]|nr:PLP-dependent transferase [Planctomycetaceae bacterium]